MDSVTNGKEYMWRTTKVRVLKSTGVSATCLFPSGDEMAVAVSELKPLGVAAYAPESPQERPRLKNQDVPLETQQVGKYVWDPEDTLSGPRLDFEGEPTPGPGGLLVTPGGDPDAFPFVCDVGSCRRPFRSRQGLGRHRSVAHGIRPEYASHGKRLVGPRRDGVQAGKVPPDEGPWACPASGCQRAFASKGSLARHRWQAHGAAAERVRGARGAAEPAATAEKRDLRGEPHYWEIYHAGLVRGMRLVGEVLRAAGS